MDSAQTMFEAFTLVDIHEITPKWPFSGALHLGCYCAEHLPCMSIRMVTLLYSAVCSFYFILCFIL
jgi:hypothetical protein